MESKVPLFEKVQTKFCVVPFLFVQLTQQWHTFKTTEEALEAYLTSNISNVQLLGTFQVNLCLVS